MIRKVEIHWQILIGIILGIFIGVYLKATVPYASVIGQIFIRALKMIVIPLIMSSLIVGVTRLSGGKELGRISLKTLLFYLATSLLALFTGLILVNIFKPGVGADIDFAQNSDQVLQQLTLSDRLLNIIPENIFRSLYSGDILPIIFFSVLFGIFINYIEQPKKQVLVIVFDSVFETMMKITIFIIRFAPLGVMGIVADVTSQQENLLELLSRLGGFAGVVIGGLLIHSLISLPLILYFTARINPLSHYRAMINVMLTAFSTASSNATLPVTMESVEKKSGVSNRIASFTLPLGATINMNGTALYELVVAGFIAQCLGIELSIGQQLVMVVTALLASVGTAGVPMASFVTLAIVFSAVGLPVEAMFIVMPIDRPLDMLRTTVNVLGDTCGAVVIAKSEKEKLNY